MGNSAYFLSDDAPEPQTTQQTHPTTPAPSHAVRAPVNGTELFYETHGSGPPMLVLHGGMGWDHSYLRPWLDPLGEQTELVYYDQRGNGRSAEPEDWETVTHQTWIEDADALREYLGHERVFVFGHSYGGFLAQEYALAYPERVAGLILCSTFPAMDFAEAVVERAQARATPEQFQALLSGMGTPAPDDKAWRDFMLAVLPLYCPGGVPASLQECFAGMHYRAAAFNRGSFGCLPHFNTTTQLTEITAPTLVLGGRGDLYPVEPTAERLHAGIPRSELVLFEKSGHFPFAEEPERFAAVARDWISRLL